MRDPLIDHFKSQWKFLRGLTNDLLESISQEEMVRSPGTSVGPWWKQFRHVGRVQENYLNAINTGAVKFGFENTTYRGHDSKEELQKYLRTLDDRLNSLLQTEIRQPDIDWFGKKVTIAKHLLYLADHELLHHGQWILYARLMGRRCHRVGKPGEFSQAS
jgi:uncharacterized damage-inducible protein DinB